MRSLFTYFLMASSCMAITEEEDVSCEDHAAVQMPLDMSAQLEVASGGAVANSTAPAVHVADGAASGTAGNRVLVEVHYETHCPFSTKFINQSLREVWADKEMRSRVDLQLYPAGNIMVIPTSKISEGYKFFHPDVVRKDISWVLVCQHGPAECLGNAVTACFMNITRDPAKYVPYAMCLANATLHGVGQEKCAYECLASSGVQPNAIKECAESKALDDQMHLWAKKKERSNATGVPWVLLDGKHMGHGMDLMYGLCQKMNPKPQACTKLIQKIKREEGTGGFLAQVAGVFRRMWPF